MFLSVILGCLICINEIISGGPQVNLAIVFLVILSILFVIFLNLLQNTSRKIRNRHQKLRENRKILLEFAGKQVLLD
ncbi:hypothetical protein [Candidatus Lokiarchaeum ossiferum]|uniref:hypothetical protein n=1 Tax=Candidatus Lokiarchaeum ossiferum TaxID=2951803 RepID=UPI00352D8D94